MNPLKSSNMYYMQIKSLERHDNNSTVYIWHIERHDRVSHVFWMIKSVISARIIPWHMLSISLSMLNGMWLIALFFIKGNIRYCIISIQNTSKWFNFLTFFCLWYTTFYSVFTLVCLLRIQISTRNVNQFHCYIPYSLT